MKIIDITKPISNNTIPWEGDPAPQLLKPFQIKNGDLYNLTELSISAHIATHIDAPKHFLDQGKTIEQLDLNKMIGQVAVISLDPNISVINAELIQQLWSQKPFLNGIQKVIFKTKNSAPEFPKHTFDKSYTALDTSGAQALLTKGIHFVGIDYHSISIYEELVEPHKILLAEEVVILEGVEVADVKEGLYQLYCLPIKIEGADGAPVRAILIQPE